MDIESSKADNRGNLVAIFDIDAIKGLEGLVIGDYNTLELVGDTVDGVPLSGQPDVMVIDIEPSGQGREN